MATTQELLDHLSKNILRDRPTTITGGVNEPLWANETLVRYLNMAQRLFARRTWCIKDNSTAAITQLSLVNGTAVYSLHKSILKVMSARLSGEQYDLAVFTNNELHSGGAEYNPNYWTQEMLVSPGKPYGYSVQPATRKIEFYYTPDGAYTVNMKVARLPLNDLLLSALTASPEIPEEYHLDLCNWAAYLALIERETDGNAKEDAGIFKQDFMNAMAAAKQDVHRAEDALPLRWHFGGW